jgi:CRP-like cAMP-binding protein
MSGSERRPHPAFFAAQVFQGLSQEALIQVSSHFHRREVPAGEILFLEGEPARVYYLIAEGRVKVLQNSPEGFQIILHVLGPGELVGALPTLGEGNYPATAEALDALTLFTVSAPDFEAVLESHPRVTRNLLRFATKKLQETHARMRELATERVERRIARTLGRLVSEFGRRTEEGILLDAPLSRQDLAEMCGTTVYTVSRTLSEWERRRWVETGRTTVVIRDPHALAVLAEDIPDRETPS